VALGLVMRQAASPGVLMTASSQRGGNVVVIIMLIGRSLCNPAPFKVGRLRLIDCDDRTFGNRGRNCYTGRPSYL